MYSGDKQKRKSKKIRVSGYIHVRQQHKQCENSHKNWSRQRCHHRSSTIGRAPIYHTSSPSGMRLPLSRNRPNREKMSTMAPPTRLERSRGRPSAPMPMAARATETFVSTCYLVRFDSIRFDWPVVRKTAGERSGDDSVRPKVQRTTGHE